MNFILESFFSSSWFLVIILILGLGLLMFASYYRRSKDEKFRDELSEKIVKGVKIKTYSGLYGKVISVRNTTDGKIVLVETGEGKFVSYQELHINAIYGLDESEEMVVDKDGNEVPVSELNKEKEEKESETKPEKEVEENKVDEVVEEKPKKSSKKSKAEDK